MNKLQATASTLNVQKIERIQNPHLYQTYMLKKQKMDQDNGEFRVNDNSSMEPEEKISAVSMHNGVGFLGMVCILPKMLLNSVRYAGNPGGNRFMYLAWVLVGQYCTGHFTMVVPPPKDPSRLEMLYDSVVDLCENPSIFVFFFDNQCYPEYLITFQ
ncbi:Protein mono-ADP-ribosyltransferase PARP14 [Acropora cervicornis]|uniref:Protein mono-ADP-ribosyltransferase PARP14 n=1 Tax=Acropora cervicornis TaxID=6130 RepID=A0AAD9VAD4_ACRCE|nr:Protein mono-ADP-ribosyltransferase PARP14 [Acropora cervicornis]